MKKISFKKKIEIKEAKIDLLHRKSGFAERSKILAGHRSEK